MGSVQLFIEKTETKSAGADDRYYWYNPQVVWIPWEGLVYCRHIVLIGWSSHVTYSNLWIIFIFFNVPLLNKIKNHIIKMPANISIINLFTILYLKEWDLQLP